MKKIARYLPLCLLLQGCIGGGVIKSHSGPYYWCDPSAKTNAANAEVYTSAWLEKHYGKPTSVSTNGLEAVWTYQSGRIWAGVMPVVIVPIPIAVPVGRETTAFFLRDGNIMHATEHRQETVGGAFGFGLGPCGGAFGPFSLEGFPK